MKNIIKFILSLFLVVSFNSCKDSNNTIDEVFQFENGAVLRTLEVLSNTLNSSEPSSFWGVDVEEQDIEDGALLKSVGVYVSIRDLTPDNGTTSASDMFIKTLDASEFDTNTPFGLPRATILVTFAEAEAAMGLSSDDHAPGDIFVFELKLELTDGRIFDASSAASIITGGFFSSPFAYNALILCTPEPGTYRLEMQDAYGDGWQSDGMEVTVGEVTTNYGAGSQNGGTDFFVMTALIDVPVGSTFLTWSWPGDSFPDEVSFQIYAPDGSLLGAFVGTDPLADYGCACNIVEVDGVAAQVAETGLLPVLLCASN